MKQSVLELALKNPDFETKHKTGDKMTIFLGGKLREIDIYTIAVNENLVYYNPENARINTALSQYKKEHPDEKIDPVEMGIESFNNLFDGFIRKQNENKYKSIKESINRFGQSTPGICMADGRILAGNNRFSALRELQKEDETRVRRFRVGIIRDADYTYNSKEIKLLELSAQNSMNVSTDYDLFNRVCDIAQTILVKEVCTKDEYKGTYLRSDVTGFLNEYDVAELLLELCAFAGINEDQMYLLEEFQVSAPLRECSMLLSKVEEPFREQVKEYMFSEMLLCRDKNANQRARSDRKLLAETKGQKERARLLDAHQKQIATPLKETLRKGMSVSPSSIKSAKDFKKVLGDAVESVIIDGKSLQEKGRDFSKNENENLAARKKSRYPIETARDAISKLSKVDCHGFTRLNNEQKVELHETLNTLIGVVHNLVKELEQSTEKEGDTN